MEYGFVLPEVMCTFPDSDPKNRLDTNGFFGKALLELPIEDDLCMPVKC